MDSVSDDSDSDDDWFYESIHRYKTLQIFDLQNTPEHVIQMNPNTVCVAGRYTKGNKSELLKLQLPKKLTLPAEEEGRSKGNDFKMLDCVYTQGSVKEMECWKDKIVTSEKCRTGLHLYTFSDDEDTKAMTLCGSNKLEAPSFSLNPEGSLVGLCKSGDQPVYLVDLDTQQPVREMRVVDSTAPLDCRLEYRDLLHILDVLTGTVTVQDLRAETIVDTVHVEPNSEDSFWSLSKTDYHLETPFYVLMSNSGLCVIRDGRNQREPIQTLDIPGSKSRVNVKTATRNRFSVSGTDAEVRIYDFSAGPAELVFTHNGHTRKKSGEACDWTLTDHIWLPNIGENFMLSVCDNSTLSCWEFVE